MPCSLSHKDEHNHDLNTPYAQSKAGRDAALRRQQLGLLAYSSLVTFYIGPIEQATLKGTPTNTTPFNPNKGGGLGRGGRYQSGEDCNKCTCISMYLTSKNDNSDCHLIPLHIKVAEDFKDVVAEEVHRLSPTPQRTAKNNNIDTNHANKDSQSFPARQDKQFPVNIYCSTLDPLDQMGIYIHKDIANIIDPLKLNKKGQQTKFVVDSIIVV
jgi:hypothetical protein